MSVLLLATTTPMAELLGWARRRGLPGPLVEIASLIPWGTGTAFLHPAIVGSRRNALARSNIIIMALTFVLCVFGTYLVRSGVVESLHAFGEGGVARGAGRGAVPVAAGG